ncbi:MAG: hypothetical protein R3C20_00225 [Planctomycetaceae bacterium]
MIASKLQKLNTNSPQVEWHSETKILVRPSAFTFPVARLIAMDWNTPGQKISERPLILNRIQGQWNLVDGVVTVHIDGTPPRGLCVVDIESDEPVLRCSHSSVVMNRRDSKEIRDFVRTVLEQRGPRG